MVPSSLRWNLGLYALVSVNHHQLALLPHLSEPSAGQCICACVVGPRLSGGSVYLPSAGGCTMALKEIPVLTPRPSEGEGDFADVI